MLKQEITVQAIGTEVSGTIAIDDMNNPDFRRGFKQALRLVNYRIDAVGDKYVMGSCEACSSILLEDDDYTCDHDGCYLCRKCTNELKEHENS